MYYLFQMIFQHFFKLTFVEARIFAQVQKPQTPELVLRELDHALVESADVAVLAALFFGRGRIGRGHND